MTDTERDDGVRIVAAVMGGSLSFFRAGVVVDALIAGGWGPLKKGEAEKPEEKADDDE